MNDIDKLWHKEIISETEHYYQGEIQQETRASWLLAINGGILAIIINFIFVVEGGNINALLGFWKSISVIAPFILSSLFSSIGIYPIISKKDKKIFQEIKKQIVEPERLIGEKFFKGKLRTNSDIDSYIYHHFISHFKRNHKKRKYVVISLISLLFGILSISINVIILLL